MDGLAKQKVISQLIALKTLILMVTISKATISVIHLGVLNSPFPGKDIYVPCYVLLGCVNFIF